MNTVALADVTTVFMGQSPPSSAYNSTGNGLPFFQGKADFGDVSPRVRMYCTEPTRTSEPGDILISVRAPVGPTNLNIVKSCIGRGLSAIRCSEKVDRKYLLYFLRFHEPMLAHIGKGSTFEAINRDDLESVCIPLPELDEQKRLAARLEKADRLRSTRRYVQELNDTFLQAVFLRMFGDLTTNPFTWPTVTIEEVCGVIVDCPHYTPKTFPAGKTAFPFIRTSDIQEGYFDWSTTKYVDFAEYTKRVARHTPVQGDVIYTREGERFGFAARVPAGLTPCLGQRVMLLHPKAKTCTSEYLWASLNSSSLYQQAFQLVGGSTSPHVNVGDIKSFKALLPPLKRQQQFSKIVLNYDRLRVQIHEAERQAEHLFQTLLHRAFAEND